MIVNGFIPSATMPRTNPRIAALVAFAYAHLRAGFEADAKDTHTPHELRQLRTYYRGQAARLVLLAGAETPSSLIHWIDSLEQPTWTEQISLN